jgi:hypothetical protein
MVKYSFSYESHIEVQIYDYSRKSYFKEEKATDSLGGTGEKEYAIFLKARGEEGAWALSAVVFYGPSGDLRHDEKEWYHNFELAVVIRETIVTTTTVVTTLTVKTADTGSLLATTAGGIVIGIVAAYLCSISRRRRIQSQEFPMKPPKSLMTGEEDEKIRRLAVLEELLSAGKIGEKTYFKLKAKYETEASSPAAKQAG